MHGGCLLCPLYPLLEKRIASGIFYLHLRSYYSLVKTWLSIRNRISPWLKVFRITLYLCSECSFVSFLNRLTANDRGSEPRFQRLHVLVIEANAVIYIRTYIFTSKNLKWSRLRSQATQAGLLRDLNWCAVKPGSLAATKKKNGKTETKRVLDILRMPKPPRGGGDSYMKQTGMLVGNFEFNP